MSLVQRFSFRARILMIVSMACGICMLAGIGVALHFNEKELHEGIVQKSRTIHSRLQAATDYVAQQGGLNQIIDIYTKKYTDPQYLSAEEKLEILKQVPIFAAMKIGAKEADKELYSFRVFSDEPRDKKNMATVPEMDVFNQFKNNPSLIDIVKDEGDIITVYRPIRLSEAQGCLNCHGNPTNSPWKNGHDVLGYKMENWSDGKLHGVFAIINRVSDIKAAKANTQWLSSSTLLGLFILLGAVLSILISSLLTRGSISKLRQVAMTLADASAQVGSAAVQISSSSTELSHASATQASSLEETAASIEQMNSMVNKNSENARLSAETSRQSQQSAERGKQVIEQMIHAIGEINSSNNRIMSQINESNCQIEDIVKVISEIGNKTKVINDIVFQTKLLSFNASVEAARAGEHGKGFAVVAEEVGNLAQMSGNAAKEISSMLESSIQKVEGIVRDTKDKVERLIAEGKEKVDSGTQVAHDCGEVLNEIVESVARVCRMSNEIATASQEQAQGVLEITKAMNQLDQVTQQNAATSEQAASAAEELSAQADSLNALVRNLLENVDGIREAPKPSSGLITKEKSEIAADIAKVFPLKVKRAVPTPTGASGPLKKSQQEEPAYDDPRFKDI